jgi:hypothetical protein
MRKTISFTLTAMMLFGVFFSGPSTADEPAVEQAVFYVQ